MEIIRDFSHNQAKEKVDVIKLFDFSKENIYRN